MIGANQLSQRADTDFKVRDEAGVEVEEANK